MPASKHIAAAWVAAFGSVIAALAIVQDISIGTVDGWTAVESGWVAAVAYVVAIVLYVTGY